MCNGDCIDCMAGAPYSFCCLMECGQHEFCIGCSYYYYD